VQFPLSRSAKLSMFHGMTKCFHMAMAVTAGVVLMVSCGNNDDLIGLASKNQESIAKGEALYAEAKSADDAGKQSKAIKLYEKVADRYAFAPSAGQARFRQAELLEQKGEILDAFEAYQQFMVRYQGSGLYAKALDRQTKMAQGAADGEVKSSILGLKRRLSSDKVVEMLGQVRDNAPRSETAAKAQFTIGELYQNDKDPKKAIDAYRKLVRDQPESKYSADALFRVGVILMEEADSGNRNQATLDLADEAFNDYLIQYPGHAKNAEARQLSKNVNGRELERSLDIAEFYYKSGQNESAKVYYRDVAKRAKSGAIYDKAKARLRELGE
jgi:outer membrane protein assembly factor BamD (BamD/ComL family)